MRGASTAIATLLLVAAIVRGPRAVNADSFTRVFVGNTIGYSADPVNYFSLSGESSRATNSVSFYIEKTISTDSSVSLLGGIRRLEIETGPATGWDNIAFSYKHIIASVQDHEFALAVNPFLEIPTGTTSTGAESHSRWGIELLAEKGLADLPEPLRALRAAAVEGDVSWETKVTGAQDDLVSADAEIEYSIDYFDRYTCAGCVGKELRRFIPNEDFIERCISNRNSR